MTAHHKSADVKRGHNSVMTGAAHTPNVMIAGGGIAGMASAVALARVGWQAQVLEQSPVFSEVGAGVQLGPNVTRILREWGLQDALLTYACRPHHLNARSADSGDVLARLDLHALAQRYGAPYVSIHRAHLHRLLCDAAQTLGVQVSGGVRVQGMDAQTIHADWAVVADGVWSQLRQSLLQDAPVRWTGHLAYRALLSMRDLPAAVRQAVRTDDVTVWMGQAMHLVCYPVAAGEQFNVVCLVEADLPSGEDATQNWNQQKTDADTRADLQAALQGTCTALHELVNAACGWRLWPLYGRSPMQGPHEHAQGRVALVGDAAHPMLPYLAQGAGMAIEDAHALAHHMPSQMDAPAIPAALQVFAQSRWPRNARVQRRAIRNGEIFHARGLMRLGRDIGLRAMGGALMDVPWLYGYVNP